jgi:hypothetical protein
MQSYDTERALGFINTFVAPPSEESKEEADAALVSDVLEPLIRSVIYTSESINRRQVRINLLFKFMPARYIRRAQSVSQSVSQSHRDWWIMV